MRQALARPDALHREAVLAHGGSVFRTVGDPSCAAFPSRLGRPGGSPGAFSQLVVRGKNSVAWEEPPAACGHGWEPPRHCAGCMGKAMKLWPVLDCIGTPLLVGLFLFFLGLETGRPLRQRIQARWKRFLTNGLVAATAAATLRLAVIPVVMAVSSLTEQANFGLLRLLPLAEPVRWVVALLILDYTVYVWHWLNHAVPFLWRFHRVHHTDLDLDVSTAFRFHAGELLLSACWRSAQMALLGVGPTLTLVFEVVQEAATEFHHSNWRLPSGVESILNRVLVTPRMHGIHHSIVERETNSNWSVLFSCWDRPHRTLRLDLPQEAVVIGVPAYRDPRELTFFSLLLMPFQKQRPTWLLPDGTHPERPAATTESFPCGGAGRIAERS
jgi:sterol desaturase/sphingolipid hydroxylase (fatty acid hydroxylase superfamily)